MQIKKVILTLVTILLVVTSYKPTFALDDGAYLIGRSTSYVNPLTLSLIHISFIRIRWSWNGSCL